VFLSGGRNPNSRRFPIDQNKRGDPLGTAMVESGYASIYATDIHKYAAHNGLPDGTLMAYAARTRSGTCC
jgi:hypothetical protein